jgi:large subunit ribosomal protein L2
MTKIVKRRSSGKIVESFEDRKSLFKGASPKSLLKKLKKNSGRDNRGRISVRHRGGGSKKLYRVISELGSLGEEVKVLRIEYDPYRTARIALVELKSGQKKYIIAAENIKAGQTVSMGSTSQAKNFDRAKLGDIPIGSQVFDIQIYPQSKKYLARAAGSSATLMALEGDSALLRLPSGEQRKINKNCFASMGQASNQDHSNIIIGKAGRVRRMGIRPSVRGKAMYPKAHPHGGGEGVNPIGLKYPKTPWGKIAMGKKTRRNRKSDSCIIKRRTKKR